MLHRQFSIRTLLVMVSLIAACLACDRVYQRWYAEKYAWYYLQTLLRDRIQDGDSFQDVARHFTTATKIDASDPKLQKVWKSRSWAIRPEDEFWQFGNQSRHGVHLQFREGHLVNYQASDFADPDRTARMNHFPVPPLMLRHGIWPICVVVLGVGGLILVALDKMGRSRARAAESQ